MDFFERLARRALQREERVEPRLPSLFAPRPSPWTQSPAERWAGIGESESVTAEPERSPASVVPSTKPARDETAAPHRQGHTSPEGGPVSGREPVSPRPSPVVESERTGGSMISVSQPLDSRAPEGAVPGESSSGAEPPSPARHDPAPRSTPRGDPRSLVVESRKPAEAVTAETAVGSEMAVPLERVASASTKAKGAPVVEPIPIGDGRSSTSSPVSTASERKRGSEFEEDRRVRPAAVPTEVRRAGPVPVPVRVPVEARPPAGPRSEVPKSGPAPVQVHIGRVEVRAVLPNASPGPVRRTPRGPRLGLAEYLRTERGGRS